MWAYRQDERGRGNAAASEGGVLAISSLPVAPLTLALTLLPNGGESETKASRFLNGFFGLFHWTIAKGNESQETGLGKKKKKKKKLLRFISNTFYVTFVSGAASPSILLISAFCFIFFDETRRWFRSGYKGRRCSDSFQMFTGRNLSQRRVTRCSIFCSFN